MGTGRNAFYKQIERANASLSLNACQPPCRAVQRFITATFSTTNATAGAFPTSVSIRVSGDLHPRFFQRTAKCIRVFEQHARLPRADRRNNKPGAKTEPYSSFSQCGVSTDFDSGEFFSRSTMLNTTMHPIARNSLCQF